jgi:formylglycine-generating enzyme required for sulfatase activity
MSTLVLVEDLSDEELNGQAGSGNEVLAERYELQQELGEGSQGRVVRAWDRKMGRQVAIKRSRQKQSGPIESWDESNLAAPLNHPNILQVLDRGLDDTGRAYIVLPSFEGGTLAEAIHSLHHSESGWTLREIVIVLQQVAEAVVYLHHLGIVHADLKPGNVLCARGRDPVIDRPWASIIDFGLSVRLDVQAPRARHGTPATMAPEVALGFTTDARIDVYALGAILEMVLTRKRRFEGMSRETAIAMLCLLPEAPLELPDPTPGGLAALARDCLAPLPEARVRTAMEVLARVQNFLARLEREERVQELLAGAYLVLARLNTLQVGVLELSERARELRGGLKGSYGEAELAPVLTLEMEVERAREAVAVAEERIDDAYRDALALSPGHPEASERLASWLLERYDAAELAHDRITAARLETRLRHLSTPRVQAWLTDPCVVRLNFERPVSWCVRLFEERRGLVELGEPLIVGFGDHLEVGLDPGAYVVELQVGPGQRIRLPMALYRGKNFRLVDPLGQEIPVEVPALAEWRPGESFVPAGWSQLGGDPLALSAGPLKGRDFWVDSFFVQKAPVRFRDWATFLNDCEIERVVEYGLLPQPGSGRNGALPLMARKERGWGMLADSQGIEHDLDCPVIALSMPAIAYYLRWIQERTGLAYRLLREGEWVRGAGGAPGRPYPWGSRFESVFCVARNKPGGATRQGPEPVGTHPRATSLHGLLDAVGNCACLIGGDENESSQASIFDPPPEGQVVVRGGHWLANEFQIRLGSRAFISKNANSAGVTIRLARDRTRR